ncbi:MULTISPECIES: hypothetical protein [unclassified Stenotrophomonas]|jgi:hypothetical protein|uniref:hypothetical protein n=1 Tax=unclassified Stenotrophomonas TaxID=196198 RepID=UPI003F94CE47
MRHLDAFDVVANLRNGRSVEQLLPARRDADWRVIRFLVIDREREGGWVVTLHEVADVGTPQYLDIYSFPSVAPDPDEAQGASFASIEAALEYAQCVAGADMRRFVNSGMAESEYRDAYHPQW